MDKIIEYPDLEVLFNPRSIAIIGASDEINKPAGLPLYFALKHQYQGKIFPVNPNRETVQGLKCYRSTLEIPEEIDVALIVLPAPKVADAFRDCAQKGVKMVVLPVSGFAEIGSEGQKRQDEVDEIARRSGIRICGPNTNGLLNVYGKVSLGYSYAQEVVKPGPLAYITQSGALLSASVPRMAERGIGFSYLVASGNQADLETFDYVRHIIKDKRTKALAIYVEGFKNPAKFIDVADIALQEQKPIVMIKVGRSNVAAKSAMSHTGSLVGSDRVVDAICKQKGVIRVYDFDELIATTLAVLKCPLPKGNRVGMVSTSGGALSLVADHALGRNLEFPDLTAETKAQGAKIIPEYGEIKNPFDIGAAGASATRDVELSFKAIDLIAKDENIDILVAAVTPIDPRGTLNFVSAVVDISKKSKKPVVLFCPMSRLRPAEEEIFREANIPMLFDAAECTTALSGLVRFADRVGKTKKPLDKALYDVQVDVEKLKGYLKTAGPILSEYETKRLLSYYGVEVVREATAKSPEEAVRIASEIGYPVVLKIDSPDIMHKTEANAIKLGVCDHNQLVGAYEEIVHNAQEYNPRANIRGVLIQEMVQDGREVIVGLSRDPQFGPTVMFGLGGVFTEVVDDVSLRVIPIHRSDAEEMIREIKGFKILEAFRGRPKADIESLIMTLLTISKLAEDLGDIILEMDLNPLLVFDEGKGAKILDASAVLRS